MNTLNSNETKQSSQLAIYYQFLAIFYKSYVIVLLLDWTFSQKIIEAYFWQQAGKA